MASKLVLDSKGLILAPGELSRTSGALTTADNVCVEAPGIIRSRFGHAKTSTVSLIDVGSIWKTISTKELGANILFNYGPNPGTGGAWGLRYGDGSLSGSNVTDAGGTYSNLPGTRMQCAVSRRNHYLTSDYGVGRLESDLTYWMAGMPKGLPLDLTGTVAAPVTVLSGAPGNVIDDGSACAYRVTWCKKDVEGSIMEGSPLGRTVVYNNTRTTGYAGGVTKNVTCRILLPKKTLTSSPLTTAYFYRLYRSRSEVAGTTPSDDMNVVAEAYLTAGNISAGYLEVTDSTPEAFRQLGDPLYTNEDGGGDVGANGLTGIQLANDPPPVAKDAVLFAGCVFYSDLWYPYEFDLTILSTVAGTGVTAADTLTIGGIVYTAIAPGAPANNEFVVATVAAGSSQSEALERTAINLCEAINRSTTNTTTWAFYISSPDSPFGKIHLESRANATLFQVTASGHQTAYRPPIASNPVADTDIMPNAYCFSKQAQADAVPRVNLGFIGRNDTAILRMIVLRDSIFMFTDAGIYRLTGNNPDNFSVREFDLSFRLIGREMVTVCGDHIYAWGYEGIAKISSAGVEYISNAIEPYLWRVISATATDRATGLSWLASYGWATSYRSQHKVLFSIPALATGNNAGNCPVTLVYDTRMNAWTTWSYTEASDVSHGTKGYSCGVVRVSDDLLILGQWRYNSGVSYLYKERRAYTASDFKDDTYTASDVAITRSIVWNAATSSPDKLAHWDEVQIYFDLSQSGRFGSWSTPTALSLSFTADFAAGSATNTMSPTSLSRLSIAPVPLDQRLSSRIAVTLTHAVVSEYFGLEGMALIYRPSDSTHVVRT